jgi:photosystem II stability/assembly factor-like uncharacterized protein
MPSPLLPRLVGLLATASLAFAAPASAPLLLDAARTPEALFAVGEHGLILRSPLDSIQWESVGEPVVETTLTGISFANAQVGWAVGHRGIILGTTDGGRSWTVVHRARDRDTSYLDVLALSPERAIVVGAFGVYLETKDGGSSWDSRRILGEDTHLNRLTQAPNGHLYLAGEAGTLLRSTDRGQKWEELANDNEGSYFGVLALREGGLLAYGLQGRVYRSDDGGDSWEPLQTGTDGVLLAGAELTDGTIVLAGQARVCIASRDGGTTFFVVRHDVPAIAELLDLGRGNLLSFGENGISLIKVP